ncbi:MAG: GntR family transcriptional regulator [Rubrobacteraceae bacterium]
MFSEEPGVSPVYRTVAGALVERIDDGRLPPGSRLPSERRLASEYRISRMTARAAVNLLAQRGYVDRRNGSGTYVSSPKVELDLSAVAGFTDRVLRHGITPGAEVIEARTVGADEMDASVVKALDATPKNWFHKLVRTRTGNGELLALEESYFPADFCPDLLDKELTGSIYELLRVTCRLEPAYLRQEIETTQLNSAVAEILNTCVDAPALRVTRTTWDTNEQVIEFARDIYRGDRLLFVTETPTKG